MTLGDLKRETKAILAALDDPALEARVLLAHHGWSPVEQITKVRDEVEDGKAESVLSDARRRSGGWPMAYITGEKEFRGLSFRVSPSVLIPRPDTESLVETALMLLEGSGQANVLDLCTGSGAIGTAISYERKISVKLSDLSEDALEIARENYLRITGEEADARRGDLFSPWEGERFDLVVSNPPYLTHKWYLETEEDVKKEPEMAFLGYGEDGLDIIRRIVDEAPRFLKKGGAIALECDMRQTASLAFLLEKKGFKGVNIVKDLSGRDRVVYGRYS